MDPGAKAENSEKKMEKVSEGEMVQDCGIKLQKTSESKEKPELTAVDTNMNLRSIPESTNVLKLEREIHNEYFQAPPLGQTLLFHSRKSKDLKLEPFCPPLAEKDANPEGEKKLEISEKLELTSGKKATEPERKDADGTVSELAELKKAAAIPFEKPGSDSPVRQVLNALQSRGSFSIPSHSRQSPDTADSDDSPSALEMEDIPAGTCVTSEDIQARPLAGLAAPPMRPAQRQKMAFEELVLDPHLDSACNTSPEGTDLGLSEEEPEMENVLAEPESAEVGGDTKHDESSGEQTYSVSIPREMQTRVFLWSQARANRSLYYCCSKKRWTCT